MAFKTVSSFSIVILMIALIFVQHVIAQRELEPSDVLELQPDGYAYADYPGVFDNANRDGITIEAWIYLTDIPKDGHFTTRLAREGRWIIFAKPGSYAAFIRGRNLDSRGDMLELHGTTYLQFAQSPQPTANNRGDGGVFVPIPIEDYPLKRWVHIAYALRQEEHRVVGLLFFDRKPLGLGEMRDPMGRTPAPFVIGGTPAIRFKEGSQWGHQYTSMRGYIDGVRVSKGLRYDIHGNIHPKRRFSADARTIALWHFAEGPGAPSYADASGNGYTLAAGGSLSVHPRDKVATTWGTIKRGTF
ncbi:MAG: hypothetical protein OXT74_17410 [Candidatus Poribacteria bacterium]|nr:hypothetical protein [Candidatus Poribacteria bacterium]